MAAFKGRVPAEEFVTIWQRAKTTAEVATKIGCTAQSASQRATSYRKRGIPLKEMPGASLGGKPLDVVVLTELANRLAAETK